MTRLRHRVSVLAYLGGWRVVRWLPERLAYAVFALVGDVIWALRGKGVRQLEANLARVRPRASDGELRRLSRDGMRSYLRYWCDTFRLPTWSEDRILAGVRTTGDECVRSLVAEGRPLVLFLGHMGNWDHAGAWSTIALARVTTVAERLEPAEVTDAFLAFRRRLGMEILNLGDPGVFGTLARRLKKDGFVPLLADRDLTARGIEVEFFGETARMAGGPAMLAEITGAELIPVTIRYERLDPARARVAKSGWGIVIEFGEPMKRPTNEDRGERVAVMLQACADWLAAGITAAPQDWHMLQKVFVADLDPARDARLRSEA
ncbi:MAG TPA: phosphatidylinositol mannoside acyltransferase [Actinomycetales bacterium]|nr:phosphatidylinositol mannoside acyltransferase [Actinomycetales bacterium]